MGKGWTQKMEKLSGIIMDSPSLVFDRCPKVGQEMPRGIKKKKFACSYLLSAAAAVIRSVFRQRAESQSQQQP